MLDLIMEMTMSTSGVCEGAYENVTCEQIDEWQQQLQGSRPEEAFTNISSALLAAVEAYKCKDENTFSSIQSPDVFNKLVHASLQHMGPALKKMLHIKSMDHIISSKKFKKYSDLLNAYQDNILKLYEMMTEEGQQELVLKHGVMPLLVVFTKRPQQLCHEFIRKLVLVWSTAEQKSYRELAFLAISRIVKMMDADTLDYTVKIMYINYVVQASRLTTPESLDKSYFMRLCVVELYTVDEAITYRHAKARIEKISLLLSTAQTTNKKEYVERVFSGEFVSCLQLWCKLLSTTHPSRMLDPLVYPIVQFSLEAMNLQKSPRYLPLVLQICFMLTDLSESTGIYIPILPFFTKMFSDIKECVDTRKESKQSSSSQDIDATYNWRYILKLSDEELNSLPVMKSLMRECALQMTRYLSVQAYRMAFPELVVPVVTMGKKCEKSSEVFGQGLARQLLRHIGDHASFVEAKRQDITFQLKDRKKVVDWETALKQENLPIAKFYKKLCSNSEDAWH